MDIRTIFHSWHSATVVDVRATNDTSLRKSFKFIIPLYLYEIYETDCVCAYDVARVVNSDYLHKSH